MNNFKKNILAVGSIAFDTIETAKGKREKILGGSSTYFSVSSSYYTDVSLIGIVGKDFSKELENEVTININDTIIIKKDKYMKNELIF